MDVQKPGGLFYQSTVRGITQTMVDGPIVYYGLTFRHTWPKDKPDFDFALEEKMVERLDGLLNGGLRRETGDDYVVNGVVERYEVFDVDSDDILVMYRIPCSACEGVITSPVVSHIQLNGRSIPFGQSLMGRIADLGNKELLALRIIIDSVLAGRAGNGQG